MRKILNVFKGLVVVLSLAAFCLGSDSASAGEVMVHVAHDHVDPDAVSINVGDVVSFHNHSHDHPAHTVVADDGSFRSPSLKGGDYWDYTFETPGTYLYGLENHEKAKGKIVVK